MEFNSYQPIYVQIMDLIKFQILRGELKPGDKLPAVREFATDLKVNPNTVQRSYSELEREGYVLSQRGIGSFVVEDEKLFKDLKVEKAKEIINVFIEDIKNLGFSYEESLNLLKESWRNE